MQFVKIVTGVLIGICVIFAVEHYWHSTHQVYSQRNTGVVTIKIPLLVDASNTKYVGKREGCDTVVMVTRSISTTTEPVNGALTELFMRKDPWQPWNSMPGNYLSLQKDLRLDRATLTDGVASIYLTGNLDPLSGVCDDPRLKTELEQTALQFPNVTSVKIFLNSKEISLIFSGEIVFHREFLTTL